MTARRWVRDPLRSLWLVVGSAAYLVLASAQLGLPGLHYDEAKEAGVNALELIRGLPVTAFRGAALNLSGVQLPLMVQDYIGALNVYLAAPFLALTGVGVPNLRALPVLTGLVTLLLVERAISEWIATCDGAKTKTRASVSLGGLFALSLLAVSPSFVFWNRQGIFVTNLMQPLCFLCVWQGVRWMRTGRPGALIGAAVAAGLALYAKLMAVWILGPFAVLMLMWWLAAQRRGMAPALTPALIATAALAFVTPLLPILVFNLKTGGTLTSVLANAGQSYYGVDNLKVAANLRVRAGQMAQTLRGEQFWYLGGTYANVAAPWLAALSIAAGLWRAPRCTWPPFALVGAAMMASAFTISDLFITHYALIYPFAAAAVGVALDRLWGSYQGRDTPTRAVRTAIVLALTLWVGGNMWASVEYHRALSHSGGLADHSDASYHLAYYLRYNGMGAPIVLDWGIEAPVRYLSEGTVRPIEIFGYESLNAPDERFAQRLAQFLPNGENVYLLHAPEQTVFAGRREAFMQAAQVRGLEVEVAEQFGQRDGVPVYEVWRTTRP